MWKYICQRWVINFPSPCVYIYIYIYIYIQTNNDTHGHDPSLLSRSTWCREFGASAPRWWISPSQRQSRDQGTSTRTQADEHLKRTPPGAGPRKKGLPIFALGKGTSVGFAVTPYPQRRRILCTELLVPFLSVGGAIYLSLSLSLYIYIFRPITTPMVKTQVPENKHMVPRVRCIRTKVMDIPFTTTIAC